MQDPNKNDQLFSVHKLADSTDLPLRNADFLFRMSLVSYLVLDERKDLEFSFSERYIKTSEQNPYLQQTSL